MKETMGVKKNSERNYISLLWQRGMLGVGRSVGGG